MGISSSSDPGSIYLGMTSGGHAQVPPESIEQQIKDILDNPNIKDEDKQAKIEQAIDNQYRPGQDPVTVAQEQVQAISNNPNLKIEEKIALVQHVKDSADNKLSSVSDKDKKDKIDSSCDIELMVLNAMPHDMPNDIPHGSTSLPHDMPHDIPHGSTSLPHAPTFPDTSTIPNPRQPPKMPPPRPFGL